MQKIVRLVVLVLLCLLAIQLNAQYQKENTDYKTCFVGSTFAMLGNLLPNEKPGFAQLNVGYRITGKDIVSLEVKTWKYYQPLGLPYGELFNSPQENFPGYIREKGFAFAYQRYLVGGFYASATVMNAWQSFVNYEGSKIDDGFQIFNTYRLGYHIKIANDQFFIEPSIAITHRPYHTEMPDSFKQQDDNYSKVFYGEPGLHFGYNF